MEKKKDEKLTGWKISELEEYPKEIFQNAAWREEKIGGKTWQTV